MHHPDGRISKATSWRRAVRVAGASAFCCVVVTTVLATMARASVWCWVGQCPDPVTRGSERIDPPIVAKADGSCQAVDQGTYFVKNTALAIDSVSEATGYCTWYTPDCQVVGGDERTIAKMQFDYTLAPGINSVAYIQWLNGIPPSQRHLMDSRDHAKTTGGLSHTPWYVGTYTYNNTATIYTTNCNILPGSISNIFKINVLACQPDWNLNQSGNIVHEVPGSPGSPSVKAVYIPPALQGTALDTAIQNAISSWNTALTNIGVPVQYSRSTTECAGPNCVKVGTGPPPPNQPNNCAENAAPTTSDGAISNAVIVTFRENWSGWNQSFMERTMAHELAHLMGIGENPTGAACSANDSLMGTFTQCGAAMSTTGPTATNTIPVQNTTYGAGTRNKCP